MSGQRRAEESEPGICGGLPTAFHRHRLRQIQWTFCFVFFFIAARLLQIQVDPGVAVSEMDRQHIGEIAIQVPRGMIYDRNNEMLATDRMTPSLWADPSNVSAPSEAALLISSVLDMDRRQVYQRLTARSENGAMRKFVWIKRWLSDAEKTALADLSGPLSGGLAFQDEPVRFYPQGDLAAHVLGFTNRDRQGGGGIELVYDGDLRSIPGKRVSRVDRGRRFLSSLTLEHVAPSGGHSVFLTIDASLQQTLEQELDGAMEQSEAPRAMGLVMDPDTGAVLALACRPAFNPNTYWAYTAEQLKNRAAVDVFEPGSAFKIVTAAAALEHGFVEPGTVIDCENNQFFYGRRRIRDYHTLGEEPFTTCFAQSSNIAIVKVASKLGPELLDAWIRRFGFGRRTCSDLAAESPGILRPVEEWSGYSMGSLPMGQELSVTIFQLARAFAVIANGGFLVEPYLVEHVVDRDGNLVYSHQASPAEQVLLPETAAVMRQLCHLVVREGTGSYANIPEYRVGGKTGTAQIARPDGGGFEPGKYTAIFAGFAPVADPRVCAVIVVQEPGIKLHYGGYICGPVFKNVVREALIQMNCPADPVKVEVEEEVPREEDPDTVAAAEPLDPTAVAREQAAIPLRELELVQAQTDRIEEEGPRLPDFGGMTKAEALEAVLALGIQWDPRGAGWVVEQYPPPGASLDGVTVCRLVFSNEKRNGENESDAQPASVPAVSEQAGSA